MSSSIKSDSSSTTMAAATSRKKKGQELTKKKPMKKSVKQQKKHRAGKATRVRAETTAGRLQTADTTCTGFVRDTSYREGRARREERA